MYKEKQMIRDNVGEVIPQYFDGNEYRPLTNERNVREIPFTDIFEVNEVATTINQFKLDVKYKYLHYISNDGEVTLQIGFNSESTGSTNKITLKAGEVVSNLNITVDTIHYSCSSGLCPFRVVGGR